MNKECKIAEMGMINMLYEMKNPLTNIRLCLEMLEKAGPVSDREEYYSIMKNSAVVLESSIRDLVNSFSELGITLHIAQDHTIIENSGI